jgi:hypothetical protein
MPATSGKQKMVYGSMFRLPATLPKPWGIKLTFQSRSLQNWVA